MQHTAIACPADRSSILLNVSDRWNYRGRPYYQWSTDVDILIGSGEFEIAEPILADLCELAEREAGANDYVAAPWYADELRRLRGLRGGMLDDSQAGRSQDEVRFLLAGQGGRVSAQGASGLFYRPLPKPAAGGLRFVLVGGEMHYVDRRGEHSGFTGESVVGSTTSVLAEEVARVATMVDSSAWIHAAALVAHRLVENALRCGNDDAWALGVGFTTAELRDSVKRLAGRFPAKASFANGRALTRPGKGRWAYSRCPAAFALNYAVATPVVTFGTPPDVLIWMWPDRSDLLLDALCDAISTTTDRPTTIVLPDTPMLRDFARRYSRRQYMTRIRRTLLENTMDFATERPNRRGTACYLRARPALVVDSDGTEIDGDELAAAAEYLDTNFNLRISLFDLIRDPLMSAQLRSRVQNVRSVRQRESEWTAEESATLSKMREWYGRHSDEAEDAALFREHCPRPLEYSS